MFGSNRVPSCTRIYEYVYVNNYCSLYLHSKSYSSLYLHTYMHTYMHVYMYLSICPVPPQKKHCFYISAGIYSVFLFFPLYFSGIIFLVIFGCLRST